MIKSKRPAWSSWCLMMILVYGVGCNDRDAVNSTKPEITQIIESVYASATVVPTTTYQPQTTRSGIITALYIEVGDTVEQGQKLIKLAPPSGTKARIERAKLSLAEAEANYQGQANQLNILATDIKTAKEKVALDSINLQRQKRLRDQNIGRKADYDQAQLAYRSSVNQLKALQDRYALTKTALANNVTRARSDVKAEYELLDEFAITALAPGIVYEITKEVGELLNPQEKFAEIGSYSEYEINLSVDEVDVTSIDLQDSVVIALESHPQRVFVARVTQIESKKDELTQTYTVKARFTDKPPRLYYGMSGEANIVVDRREQALVIPTQYLTGSNQVRTADGLVDVTLGMRNIDFVEVISGIDTSTVIYQSPTQ